MSGHTPGPWSLETVATSCGSCHKIGPFPGAGHRREVHACVYADGIRIGMDESNPAAKELLANARLIAAAPDHAAIARALCFGIARWEPFPSTSRGEFCIGGMRHVTNLDEFGVPVMTSGMRAAIAAATGEKV